MRAPAAQRSIVRRPELEKLLDEAFGRRVLLVVAGAGYGKTTALAEWAADLEAAWYTLSPRDRRLVTFATGVADVLRPWIGEPDAEFRAALGAGGDELLLAETLAGYLASALESLQHDIVLVLDDAGEVGGSPPALRLIEALCRQCPALAHVVVSSRQLLDLRIERIRAHGETVLVDARELVFGPEDVAELATTVGLDDPDLVARVQAASGGWPVCVRLMLEALAGAPPDRRLAALDRMARPGTALFDYLAHEVFGKESADVQRLVRIIAPLERLDIALCTELVGPGARETVERLVERGLLVRADADEVVLHALAREYAGIAWPLDADETRSVHLAAARWFESEGRVVDALHALQAAGHADGEIARLLHDAGEAMLTAGETSVVAEVIGELPAALRDARLERLHGEALFVRGDADGAIACYERAATLDGVDAGLAWRLGLAHHFRGDGNAALASYERAPAPMDSSDDALCMAWEASARRMRGDFVEARVLADEALRIAELTGDDRALAAAYVAVDAVTGEVDGSMAERDHLGKALAAAERCNDLIQLRRIRVNRTAALVDRGLYEAALDEIGEAVALSVASDLAFDAHVLTNRGRIYLRLGRLDEARADYSSVIERELENTKGRSGLGFLGVGDVHRERGSVALARSAYETSLRLSAESGRLYGESMSRQGLARVLVDDDPEDAYRLARQACEPRWAFRPWALNTLGWVALALGSHDEAAEVADEALALARATNDAWALAEGLEVESMARDPEQRGVLLEEALTVWQEIGARVRIAECGLALTAIAPDATASAARSTHERALRALGVSLRANGPAGLLRLVARAAPVPVEIHVLADFRVVRDGVAVPHTVWQSRKSRDLLKILVCRRGHPIAREMLMEALWPGDDPTKLANRFSVCLSTLRSVLDPERRFAHDHFVKADGAGVRLDLETVLVDVEVFTREAETGLACLADGDTAPAADWLAQAESSYSGNVLESDAYEDWVVALREEALALYLDVVHALATLSAGSDGASARYFLRILGHDPYDERAHIGLVTALERTRRRGEARRAYRTYVARMESIGVTPAAFPIA